MSTAKSRSPFNQGLPLRRTPRPSGGSWWINADRQTLNTQARERFATTLSSRSQPLPASWNDFMDQKRVAKPERVSSHSIDPEIDSLEFLTEREHAVESAESEQDIE